MDTNENMIQQILLTPIQAIKDLRALCPGMGLKEAKDHIDTLRNVVRFHNVNMAERAVDSLSDQGKRHIADVLRSQGF